MSYTKHTPGPWQNTLTGIKANGKLIAQAWCDETNNSFGNHPAVTYSEMKANNYLIAAAPDMLEALQIALKESEQGIYKPSTIKLIESAIAKATGK